MAVGHGLTAIKQEVDPGLKKLRDPFSSVFSNILVA
jgi:hypothetical protein